ncbi:MAG: response regulator [Treponema sp.]|nr:response regulator [Treponema sp.]
MYSIVGILALIILFITNRDFFFCWTAPSPVGMERQPDGSNLPDESDLESAQQAQTQTQLTQTQRLYRAFLFGVFGFYLTDILWGFFDAHGLVGFQFVDTSLYFFAMSVALLFWTSYVVSYLKTSSRLGILLLVFGNIFFALELVAIVANIFLPILFWFDDDGNYQAGLARHASFVIQSLMFLCLSFHVLHVAYGSKNATQRHYLAIGLFGITMVIFIAAQIVYPQLPLYAMGYMIGTCLIHSFVVEDEKEVYRDELEKALERERGHMQDLMDGRKALKEALDVAQNASRAKTAFLSNMSHEIRTPMNAIIGLNSIALEEPTASDAVKEHLSKIKISAHHLLDLINDILDMTRIESGSMEIKNEDFSLASCLVYVNNIIESQCKEKGLDYECSTKGDVDGWYRGDAVKLKQVLINILGNSVKFTPAGGSIRLTVEEKSRFNGQVTLAFVTSDTGIGISEEFLPHIFDAFSKEDVSMTSKYGSTGLGMAITKSIVDRMSGQIEVKSKRGEGTSFTVTITFAESSDDKSNNAESGEQDAVQQVAIAKAEDGRKGLVANSGDGRTEGLADLKGRHVLLAEDMEVNAEIVVMLLRRHDVEVDVARNGKLAVQMFTEHPAGYYDAILMDMRMPEMDGLEATKCIRSSGRSDAALIPIVALTANAFDEDVKRSLQAGLNAHLSKPIEPDVLFNMLGTLIYAAESAGKK